MLVTIAADSKRGWHFVEVAWRYKEQTTEYGRMQPGGFPPGCFGESPNNFV